MNFKNYLVLLLMVISITACQSFSKPATKPMPQPVVIIDGDDDQDGVLNSVDACPNTPMNIVVDGKGCPREVSCYDCDVPNYEARLFFNRNENYPSENVPAHYREGFYQNKDVLERLAKNYQQLKKEYPKNDICIWVEGHNSKGKFGDYNDKLSTQRAFTIKQILKENYSIDDKHIFAIGFGSRRPIANSNTDEGRTMNQRVYMDIKACSSLEK